MGEEADRDARIAPAPPVRFRPHTVHEQECFCCCFILRSTASFSIFSSDFRSSSLRLNQKSFMFCRSWAELVFHISPWLWLWLLCADRSMPADGGGGFGMGGSMSGLGGGEAKPFGPACVDSYWSSSSSSSESSRRAFGAPVKTPFGAGGGGFAWAAMISRGGVGVCGGSGGCGEGAVSGGSDWGLAISRVRVGAHLRLPGSDGGGSDIPARGMVEWEAPPDRHWRSVVVVHAAAASPTHPRSVGVVCECVPALAALVRANGSDCCDRKLPGRLLSRLLFAFGGGAGCGESGGQTSVTREGPASASSSRRRRRGARMEVTNGTGDPAGCASRHLQLGAQVGKVD
ncbi:hypothetical protein KC335_g110 [Hortaea werneckii]|nr:hypothetical protein KC335_g110 [Hortaea werneckii]